MPWSLKLPRLRAQWRILARMPPSNLISALLLTQKAEIKSVKIPAAFTLEAAKKQLKKKEEPDTVVQYASKPYTFFVFGYSKGKAGTENKHELPPPHDSILFFGDCLLVASKSPTSYETPVAIKPEDYETFYTKAFGGFEDLDEDEDEDEEVDAEEEAEEDKEGNEFDEVDEGEASEVDEEPEPEVEEAPPPPKRTARKGGKAAAAVPIAFTTYTAIAPDQELKPGTVATGIPVREACLKALTGLFGKLLESTKVAQLEQVIYQGTLREADVRHVAKSWTNEPFVYLYQMYARHISANLHPGSYVGNKELWALVESGAVSLEAIPTMNSYDLSPAHWKDSFDKQQVREKTQLEGNRAMATDQFLCTRCWKRECTYYEMQTRSADEPMTIFITCVNCGKHWRQ